MFFDLPPGFRSEALLGIRLTISLRETEHPADLVVTTALGIYGVWYQLPAGRGVLAGANEELYLEPETLALTSGRILRVQGQLAKQLFTTPD